MKNYLRYIAALLLCLPAAGCGGSSDDSQPFATVDEITFRDGSVPAGGTTNVRVHFTPASTFTGTDSDGDPTYESAAFTLVVNLPPDTGFVPGSSKLSDDLFGDAIFGRPDKRQPDGIVSCAGGGSALVYQFPPNQFGDPVNGGSSFYVKFDLHVDSGASGAAVTGAAGAYDANPCAAPAESSKELVVAP